MALGPHVVGETVSAALLLRALSRKLLTVSLMTFWTSSCDARLTYGSTPDPMAIDSWSAFVAKAAPPDLGAAFPWVLCVG